MTAGQASTSAPAGAGASPQGASELIERYYEKGWSDGLPVMPPTEASVGAMLAAGGLRGDEVLGEVAERNVRVTADKVAVNAVMAGCRPEYMPVVAAAVKGICHPDFGYHGAATSTGGAAVVTIVNGPVAKALGINAEGNAFGPGFRPNATIGRAVRLVMMNAINTRPGKLDRSTLGHPGKIGFCFAENEAVTPWAPLHVERGYAPEQSTVTVFASDGLIQVYNQLATAPETLLLGMADALANSGSMNIVGQACPALVLAGEHTETLRRSGWSKQQVQQFVHENATRTVAQLKRAGRLEGEVTAEDEQTRRHVVRRPEDVMVICAGGAAGSFSAVLTAWGSHRMTAPVTTPVQFP